MVGRRIALVAAGLLSGCVLPMDIVRQRFTADTQCVEQSVQVSELPGSAYRADGCGLSATYVCTVQEGQVLACIRESAVQAVGPGASDAGGQAR